MKIELRSDGIVHIEGYVNAVCRDSRPMLGNDGRYFVEQVEEGVFGRALEKNTVVPMHNHERAIEDCKNFSLHEDAIGLYASFDTNDGIIRRKAEKKELRGWSFGFSDAVSRWETRTDGVPRRYISDLTLREISLIDNDRLPCYKGTTVSVRSENCTDTADGTKETRMLECRAEYSDGNEYAPNDNSSEEKVGEASDTSYCAAVADTTVRILSL